MRGVGKSSVGRTLAARLGWSFVDTDERVEQEAGRSIREIFERDGEEVFRRLESTALEHASRAKDSVISAGGGAVLSAENRRLMKSRAACVWLTASIDELSRRVSSDPSTADRRPPLTAAGGAEELELLLAQRRALYEDVAYMTLDTTGVPVEQTVAELLRRLSPTHGVDL